MWLSFFIDLQSCYKSKKMVSSQSGIKNKHYIIMAILKEGKAVGLACDHAGYEMKERVKAMLQSRGYECKDFGCYSTESYNRQIEKSLKKCPNVNFKC